jgi:hypothetical protein
MKTKITAKKQKYKAVIAALVGILLVAAPGCIHITNKLVVGQVENSDSSRGSTEGIVHGGNFVPVQSAPLGGGGTTVCNQPVSSTYVRFANPVLWQIPDADVIGFQGTVVNTNTQTIIPNTDYYLQWYVNSNPTNQGCCTNLTGSTTEVGCKIIPGIIPPGRPHRFTAFFKVGKAPQSGHQIRLDGTWIKQP